MNQPIGTNGGPGRTNSPQPKAIANAMSIRCSAKRTARLLDTQIRQALRESWSINPAAAGRFWRADFCFSVGRHRRCSCKFSFGNLDAELLPFSKVAGEFLWSCFCFAGRSATRRFKFFSPECEAAKAEYVPSRGHPYHSDAEPTSSAGRYGFHPVSQPRSRVKLNAGRPVNSGTDRRLSPSAPPRRDAKN